MSTRVLVKKNRRLTRIFLDLENKESNLEIDEEEDDTEVDQGVRGRNNVCPFVQDKNDRSQGARFRVAANERVIFQVGAFIWHK